MEWTDDELVKACLDGQKDAFAGLVERYEDAVYNLAYRMAGNHADASDLAQEAFIRAFRKLNTYRTGQSFRNWVMGICANLTKNRFRGEARRRAVMDRHAEFAEIETDTVGLPDARRETMERALGQLTDELKAPLVMKYMEGSSIREIAQMLGIGLSAAKMRLVRAREELLRRVRALQGEMLS